MGLDITAYRGLVEATDVTLSVEWEYLDSDGKELDYNLYVGIDTEATEADWKGRTAPLKPRAVYTFAEEFGFRAGSYGGYGDWRNHLAKMAGFNGSQQVWGLPRHVTGAFVEQISFSDCEGVIGSNVASKLYQDYTDFQSRAETYAETLGEYKQWFLDKYALWRKAFEMAAQNGCVMFH